MLFFSEKQTDKQRDRTKEEIDKPSVHLYEGIKSINPCQLVHSAQADTSRNILIFLNFLLEHGGVYLKILSNARLACKYILN